jgi:hypothetical protein
MNKKDVLDQATPTAKNLIDHLRCGECFHFKVQAHSEKGEPCEKLGVNPKGLAPRCFTPDVTQLGMNGDQLASLTSLLQGSTRKSRRILMAVLNTKSRNRDYPLGTKIYWRPIGGDYVSNYVAGFVLISSNDGTLIVSGDPDRLKRGGQPYTATISTEHDILDYQSWKERRATLIQQNRIQDPETRRISGRNKVGADYEPPTLDTAPNHWFNKTEEAKPRRRVREVTEDLKNE